MFVTSFRFSGNLVFSNTCVKCQCSGLGSVNFHFQLKISSLNLTKYRTVAPGNMNLNQCVYRTIAPGNMNLTQYVYRTVAPGNKQDLIGVLWLEYFFIILV